MSSTKEPAKLPRDQSPDPPSLSAASVITPYPFLDTLSMLALMMVLPKGASVLVLLFYSLLGNPRILESSLSLFVKHRMASQPQPQTPTGADSPDPVPSPGPDESNFFDRLSVHALLAWFAGDLLIVGVLFLVSPGLLEYVKLLAKAFVASRLTSTRQRGTWDALGASAVLLGVEKGLQYAVYFPLSPLLSVSLGDSHRSPLVAMLYRSSFSPLESHPRVVLAVEILLECVYSTLAVYTILRRLDPLLSNVFTSHSLSKSLDNMAPAAIPKRAHLRSSFNPRSRSGTALSPHSSHLHLRTAASRHDRQQQTPPPSRNVPETVVVTPEVSRSVLPSLLAEQKGMAHKQELLQDPFSGSSTDTPMSDSDDNASDGPTASSPPTSTPASFPLDEQLGNMNDISSPSVVVAQNFENYCRVALQFGTPSYKAKLTPYLEKQLKNMSMRNNQPLWVFVNAARTMFGSRDLYSGEYYQHNALVPADPVVEEHVRSGNGSSQCFVWYTGETAVAFELRGITLDQLLARVNGIIWEHVSSASLYGRELVMVNGLSPLSQYDIDFIRIRDNGELQHFASTTVSTVYKNRTVTESKPSTPLATLQESVVTTQSAIDREKAKLKKLKTDWRKKSAALKTEIENLNNRANVSDESRNYKKVESLRQAVASSDLKQSAMSKRLDELYTEMTETDEKYLDCKRSYESEMRIHNAYEKERDESLQQKREHIDGLLAEKSQLLQKKEKMGQKNARIGKDVDALGDAIEQLKDAHIAWRRDTRKERAEKRQQKYLLLLSDINKFEKQSLTNQ